MTDLSKLTAKDFSVAMHKGWKGLKWCSWWWFKDADKLPCRDTMKPPVYACAIGAISVGLKITPDDVVKRLRAADIDDCTITHANNEAGNKRAAMKAVDAILLNTPAVRGGE